MADLRWGSSWNQAVTPAEDFETVAARFERDYDRMEQPTNNVLDPMSEATLNTGSDANVGRKNRKLDRQSTERKARTHATVGGANGNTATSASGSTTTLAEDGTPIVT